MFTLLSCSIREYFSSSTFFRTIYHNFSNIDDYKKFPYRRLHASPTPFHFNRAIDPSRLPQNISIDEQSLPLDEFLDTTNTVAFLVVKDDRIIFEDYREGFDKNTIAMSFSVTKSFVSALIGCAINDGLIDSVEQPVTDFIPEMARNGFDKVRIKHLLQMTSGLDYTESDNPFGIHSRSYQRARIEETILDFTLKEEPGQNFQYKSGDTLILGLILAKVLAPRNTTDYLQEKIWTPIGMESDGLWNIYEDGLEKSFCCLSATARDFAKFGRLYLNHGKWNGKQIIPADWISQSTKLDTTEGSVWFYQYGWYVMSEKYGDFRAEGVRGQFIYVNPRQNLIIVRLGRSRGITWDQWRELFGQLSQSIQ